MRCRQLARLVMTAGAITVMLGSSGCLGIPGGTPSLLPLTYDAAPITIVVVDAATRERLPDVLAVAHWELEYPYEGYVPGLGQMMVLRTVSEADGVMRFPAWGPKARRDPRGVLRSQSPAILLFRAGWRPRILLNEARGRVDRSAHRTSDWDQREIALEPAGALADYAASLKAFDSGFDSFPYSTYEWLKGRRSQCEWRETLPMLRAIERERRRLAGLGVPAPSLPESLAERAWLQAKSPAEIAACGRIDDVVGEGDR